MSKRGTKDNTSQSTEHLFKPDCPCEDCKQVMYDYEYKMYCQNCGDFRSDCECVSGYDD